MVDAAGHEDEGSAGSAGSEPAPGASSGSSPPRRRRPREIPYLELVTTILMALAAILTAWCGFQATKWSGVQATNFSRAGADRTESTRASTLAGQQTTVDVVTFLEWLSAAQADIETGAIPGPDDVGPDFEYRPTEGTLSGFLFERFRDEFRPAVDAWLTTGPFTDPAAPATPFDMSEYELAAATEAEALRASADEDSAAAREANQNGDDYVMTTILAALVLFFAGLANKLVKPRNQLIALGLGAVIFVGTVATVLSLPIEV